MKKEKLLFLTLFQPLSLDFSVAGIATSDTSNQIIFLKPSMFLPTSSTSPAEL